MRPVYYTKIDLYDGITELDVMRRAHALGFEMIPFNGWDDNDLGTSGNHGPCWHAARLNHERRMEIIDSLIRHNGDNTYDAILINDTRKKAPNA